MPYPPVFTKAFFFFFFPRNIPFPQSAFLSHFCVGGNEREQAGLVSMVIRALLAWLDCQVYGKRGVLKHLWFMARERGLIMHFGKIMKFSASMLIKNNLQRWQTPIKVANYVLSKKKYFTIKHLQQADQIYVRNISKCTCPSVILGKAILIFGISLWR